MKQRARPYTPDIATRAVGDAHDALFRQLRAYGPLEGKSLSGTVPAGSTLTLQHGLGRQPRGWTLHDIAGSAGPVYRSSWDATDFVLANSGASDAAVVVWIW